MKPKQTITVRRDSRSKLANQTGRQVEDALVERDSPVVRIDQSYRETETAGEAAGYDIPILPRD